MRDISWTRAVLSALNKEISAGTSAPRASIISLVWVVTMTLAPCNTAKTALVSSVFIIVSPLDR